MFTFSQQQSNKNVFEIFENRSIAFKFFNILEFIDKSNTINLNSYSKSPLYIILIPYNSSSYSIKIIDKNNYISEDSDTCFDITVNKKIIIKKSKNADPLDIKIKNQIKKCLCNNLVGTENTKLALPQALFTYGIDKETDTSYLLDIASFDSILYLQIEFGLLNT